MKKRINSYLLMLAGMSIGGIAGAAIEFRLTQKQINHWKNMSNKHLKLMILLNQWFATKQEKKSIDAYFHKNKIENIAIYGMSYVGERLLDELRDSDITVKYAVDQNADNIYAHIDVILPGENMPEVDAIVVTPIYYYYEIQEMLSSKVDCKIISLEDILNEI